MSQERERKSKRERGRESEHGVKQSHCGITCSVKQTILLQRSTALETFCTNLWKPKTHELSIIDLLRHKIGLIVISKPPGKRTGRTGRLCGRVQISAFILYLVVVLRSRERALELVGPLAVLAGLLRHPGQLRPELPQGLLEGRLLGLELPPQVRLGVLPRQQVVGAQLLGSLHGLHLALVEGLCLWTGMGWGGGGRLRCCYCYSTSCRTKTMYVIMGSLGSFIRRLVVVLLFSAAPNDTKDNTKLIVFCVNRSPW